MRDVNEALGVPTREVLKAKIPDQARFRPQPKLIEKVQWRWLPDGAGEAFNKPKQRWVRVNAIYVEAYKGLEEGLTFEEIVERAFPKSKFDNPRVVARYLRGHIWELYVGGYVDIPLPPPPDVFGGRYRRVKELGRGGMGVAHLCLDEDDGDAEVVVKHAWGWRKPIYRAEATIHREAAVMRMLDHPGIVKVKDTFEQDHLLHLVRDYGTGRPLEDLLRTAKEAPSSTRLRLGHALAGIVRHMHERGLLFLDPKPDNFLLADLESAPLLIDVGICRPHEDGVAPLATPVGTPGYVAPEIVAHRVASVRSDVWGIGRVMAAMALGRRTRQSWDADALAAELAAAGVPDAERAIIAAMTAQDPAARPASMEDAQARIQVALGGA